MPEVDTADDHPRTGRLPAVLRSVRTRHAIKNLLLAVPLLTSHRVTSADAVLEVVIAIIAFSCITSAGYLFNDVVDVGSDRHHPQKRLRPVAAGELAVPRALGIAVSLLAGGLLLGALLLNRGFAGWMVAYVVLAAAYSLDLRRRLLLDVLALAALYTVRILAGGAAAGIAVSDWLLTFAMTMFASLAFLKRFVELQQQRTGHAGLTGRAYLPVDRRILGVIGPAMGCLSVLVLALYINSPDVHALYSSPRLLWLLCVAMLYWIARIWVLGGRGVLTHDPLEFAATDANSYVVAAVCMIVILAATMT